VALGAATDGASAHTRAHAVGHAATLRDEHMKRLGRTRLASGAASRACGGKW
jgi:hypothetical protein